MTNHRPNTDTLPDAHSKTSDSSMIAYVWTGLGWTTFRDLRRGRTLRLLLCVVDSLNHSAAERFVASVQKDAELAARRAERVRKPSHERRAVK